MSETVPRPLNVYRYEIDNQAHSYCETIQSVNEGVEFFP